MFDGRVLGVDPGLAALGLAVLDPGRPPVVVWAGTERTRPGAEPERLVGVYEAVCRALAAYRPRVAAVERLLWGRNVGSAMEVARAAGVAVLACAQAGVPVREYAPLEVKMAATGSGNASKQAVRSALGRVHAIEAVPGQPDAADAVAVAFCHLQHAALRARVEVAGR